MHHVDKELRIRTGRPRLETATGMLICLSATLDGFQSPKITGPPHRRLTEVFPSPIAPRPPSPTRSAASMFKYRCPDRASCTDIAARTQRIKMIPCMLIYDKGGPVRRQLTIVVGEVFMTRPLSNTLSSPYLPDFTNKQSLVSWLLSRVPAYQLLHPA